MSEVILTRDTFIADNHVEIAISKLKTIWVIEDGDSGIKKIRMPKDMKQSGVLPEGYCVDFVMDPITVVHALAGSGIKYESHLPKECLDDMKATINSPKNLSIVPVSVWEEKLQNTIKSLGPIVYGPPQSTEDEAIPDSEEKENGGAVTN